MILYSLTFGVFAWFIAFLGALNIIHKPLITIFISFTLGFASVGCELLNILRRVRTGDTIGILHTAGVVVFGLGVMMSVTVILNLAAIIAYAVRRKMNPDKPGK